LAIEDLSRLVLHLLNPESQIACARGSSLEYPVSGIFQKYYILDDSAYSVQGCVTRGSPLDYGQKYFLHVAMPESRYPVNMQRLGLPIWQGRETVSTTILGLNTPEPLLFRLVTYWSLVRFYSSK
jgi:hypothetical protein